MAKVGILGDRLIEKNKMKIENSFNTLLRKSGKTTVYQKKAKGPFTIRTADVEKESIAVGNLRHNSTAFYSSDYAKELETEVREILDAVIEDESFPKSASKEINAFLFKSPIDLVFTKFEPERKFIDHLCKTENTKEIEAWMKSRDMGFYSIEYSITSVAGKHSKVQAFNPDFFIKIKKKDITHFVIVETKYDGDVSPENKAKNKYAKQHFENLNTELEARGIKEVYHFHFLSPSSYIVFFDHLRKGQLLKDEFRSELEDKLEEESE